MLCGVAKRRGRSGFPKRERWEGKLRGVDDFESLAFTGLDEFVVDEQTSSIEISTKQTRSGDGLGIYGCWYDLPFGSLIWNFSQYVRPKGRGELTVTSDMIAFSMCFGLVVLGLKFSRRM
jgi:hypothetical protein